MPEENAPNQQQEQPGTQPPATAPDTKSGKGDDPNNPSWLPERLKDAKKSAQSKLLKELGFENAEDAQAFIADAKKLKESQMSEADKLKADLATAQRDAEAAKQRAQELETARITDKVEGAIKTAAMSAKAEIPGDVVTLLKTEGKFDPAKMVDADGNISESEVTKLIDEAKKLRPSWFGRVGGGSHSNAGGKPQEPNASEKEKAQRDLMANLRNRF